MAINPQGQKMTVEEYFALDADPSAKYEYINGCAVVMSGGSVAHEWIAKNIMRELDRRLRPGPCRTHTSDMKVLVPAWGSYFLPDVTVSCDADDNRLESQAVRSPIVIMEVLSPHTEHKDRHLKLLQYTTLPSLQEYVLINTRYQFVEVFRRQPDDTWPCQEYRPKQLIKLHSLGINLTFAKIYADVPLPAKPLVVKEASESYTVS